MEVNRDNALPERCLTGLFDQELMSRCAQILKAELVSFSLKTSKLTISFLFLKKKNNLICPPTFAYNSIVPTTIDFSSKSNQRHWFEIVGQMKKHLPKHGIILCHPWFYDLRPFIWNKYKVDILYTFRNNLKWKEQDVDREEMKQINKAIKNNLTVVDNLGSDQLIELLFQSYRRHHRKPPYSRDFIYNLLELTRKNKSSRVISIVNDQQNLLAFRIKLQSSMQDYDWIAGSNLQGLKLGANAYALRESIKQSLENHKIIDLCGANTKSIALFKAGFNMSLIPYARISW